jgi:hypothetical protein
MDSIFLRRVLLIDGLVSGAAALAMIAGAGLMAPLLSLPQELMTIAGVTLIPWVIALAALSRMVLIPRAAIRAVIAINLAWVAGSIAVLFFATPSLFGTAFVIAQAVTVGLFAELQMLALKREPRVA